MSAAPGYARLQFSWLEDDTLVETLSGEAFRLFVLLNAHCAKDLTDGWVSPRLLRTYLRDEEHLELVATGYLVAEVREERGSSVAGYALPEFLDQQKSRKVREAEKEGIKERVTRSRARKKAGEPVTPNVTRYNGDTRAGSKSESGSRSRRDTGVASSDDLTSVLAQEGAARRQDGGGAHHSASSAEPQRTLQGDNRHSDSASCFALPATPHFDPAPPPRGKPAEVGGSDNFDQPLHASQAETLLVARISPERFVRQMRSKAEAKGWERLDWAALVAKQRYVKALAVRQGEVEALLPRIEAWLEEGAS